MADIGDLHPLTPVHPMRPVVEAPAKERRSGERPGQRRPKGRRERRDEEDPGGAHIDEYV